MQIESGPEERCDDDVFDVVVGGFHSNTPTHQLPHPLTLASTRHDAMVGLIVGLWDSYDL